MATPNRKSKHKRGIMASSNPTKVLLLGPAKVKHSYKTICAKFSVRVYMHIAELKLFDFCWAYTIFPPIWRRVEKPRWPTSCRMPKTPSASTVRLLAVEFWNSKSNRPSWPITVRREQTTITQTIVKSSCGIVVRIESRWLIKSIRPSVNWLLKLLMRFKPYHQLLINTYYYCGFIHLKNLSFIFKQRNWLSG